MQAMTFIVLSFGVFDQNFDHVIHAALMRICQPSEKARKNEAHASKAVKGKKPRRGLRPPFTDLLHR